MDCRGEILDACNDGWQVSPAIPATTSAHMWSMEIAGRMQLKLDHIVYDPSTRTVRLAKDARG